MITLETTKTAFDIWRATKTNSNTPTPTKLWNMVRHLLPTHKMARICKALHISGSQIKKHCIEISTSEGQKPQFVDNDFVEALPLPISSSVASTSELTLKGSNKSLHICLPTSALREILPALGELL